MVRSRTLRTCWTDCSLTRTDRYTRPYIYFRRHSSPLRVISRSAEDPGLTSIRLSGMMTRWSGGSVEPRSHWLSLAIRTTCIDSCFYLPSLASSFNYRICADSERSRHESMYSWRQCVSSFVAIWRTELRHKQCWSLPSRQGNCIASFWTLR